MRRVLRWTLGLLFVAAGAAHFARPAAYARMVPPYFPGPLALAYLSGAAEVTLGLLVLVPRFAPAAGWGLVVLLVAVFPANVHMALHPELFPHVPPAALWVRLPFQAVFMAWAYWATRPPPPAG